MSPSQREAVPERWEELDGAEVDLVVVGGGITGAGVAWDAALRGARVLLFEKRDFASGTSSRSSKLIHGGLRYLEQLEFKLIFEAVNERARLRRLARHLVRPLGFYFPRYRGERPGLATLSLGLYVYEALVGFRVDGLHRRISPATTVEHVPGLREEGLVGSVFYYDAKAQDARLVWETILGAHQAGAGVFNYTEVLALERRGERWHVRVRDRRGEEATCRARTVVLAVGPWGNVALERLLGERKREVRPSKGIHVVVPQELLPIRDAVVMQHPRDRRVTFAIPGRHFVYAGTTDTFYEGDLEEPGVTAEDVDYMLEVLAHYFPGAGWGPEVVTATWSGLRPLVPEPGKSASQVSREHVIDEVAPGCFTIEGGKLTSYRLMAEQAVDLVARNLAATGVELDRCRTKREPLPGARGLVDEATLAEWIRRTADQLGGDRSLARHLVESYGTRTREVLPYVEREPEQVLHHLPYRWGELRWLVETEAIWELEDLCLRRTEIYYQDPDNGLGVAERLADLVAEVRGLTSEERTATLERYRRRVAAGLAFRADPGTQRP